MRKNSIKKILLLLGVLLVLSSALVLPATATTEISSMSPTSGPPGTTVRIIGETDTKGGYYQIIGFGRIVKEDQCAANNKTVDTTFIVPDYLYGVHTILLIDKATAHFAITTFTITTKYLVSTLRCQEGLNTTITLSLNGGINSTVYQFNVTVTDPRGQKFAKIVATPPTVNGTTQVTLFYYGDFPSGANTNFNGTYTMVVDEKYPGTSFNVATGSFIIGLTNETTYKSFETVNIHGSGFNSTETVTVNITYGGTPIVGYPKNVTAHENGTVTDSWTIPGAASLGTYTASLTGQCVDSNTTKRTIKEPPDAQNFTVEGIQVLTITVTDQPSTSYQRTETASMRFRITYPDGTNFTASDLESIQVRVYKNATNIANVTLTSANFDPATKKWTSSWMIPWDISPGIGYKFTVYANEVVDKHGNSGPADSVSSSSFSLMKAILTVDSIRADKATYQRGETITVYFTATYPSDSSVNTGNATITLTMTNGSTKQIMATYISTRNRYEAKYVITLGDPIGSWTAQLSAYDLKDAADNIGPTSARTTTFAVATPPTPPMLIKVNIRIHPETLNLKSHGNWITVEIGIPESYSAKDIAISSIRLNGTIPVDSFGPIETQGQNMIVKFDRSSVASLIQNTLGTKGSKFVTVTLTITGQVSGTPFQGSDTIRIKA